MQRPPDIGQCFVARRRKTNLWQGDFAGGYYFRSTQTSSLLLMPRFKPPGDCPVCSEFVPRGFVSCPSCGSCGKSGWNADIDNDGLDLPDDPSEFDYDDFVAREFGGTRGAQRQMKNLWWWVALVLLGVFVLTAFMAWR